MKLRNLFLLLLAGMLPATALNARVKKNKQKVAVAAVQQQTKTDFVRSFYESYLKAWNDDKEEAVAKQNMTAAMYENAKRIEKVTEASVVLRAQDITDNMLKSLRVEDAGGNWAKVSYKLFTEKGLEVTEIPVEAVKEKGQWKISYIVPEWRNEDAQNNYYLTKPLVTEINYQSEKDFLESFLKMYAGEYCQMQTGLPQKLAQLRNEYCSQDLRTQFDAAAKEYADDGKEGFDEIIQNFAFDAAWFNTLKIEDKGNGVFAVSYEARHGNVVSYLCTVVVKGNFRLDKVEKTATK